MIDLTGKVFGKWKVLEFSYRKGRDYYWKCQCECGVIKDVSAGNLKSGKSTQCKQCFYGKPIDNFNKHWILDIETGCWLWLGSLNKYGYGQFLFNNKTLKAHRFSYEYHIGPIPDGLVIDHLCRVPECVNPNHLEAVTQQENVQRGIGNPNKNKTHCKNGHEFTDENTYVDKNGSRYCRECKREWSKKYREKKKRKL